MAERRVMVVSSHARLGGAERYVERLADALGGTWVGPLVALEQGPLVDRLHAAGHPVEVIETGPHASDILSSARRLRHAIRRRRPGAVHANGLKAALVASLAMPATGVPLVWKKHDFSYDGALVRAVGSRCAVIIAVSQAVAAIFGSHMKRRVVIVHNGIPTIDIDRASARAALERTLPPRWRGECYVALLGRFDPRKGHEHLLAAAPIVLEMAPKAKLLLVGPDDPAFPQYRRELATRIEERGLGDTVALLPHTEESLNTIAASDVVAVPSVDDADGRGREGFSWVALEGLATGTPVVAYAHGGVAEVLDGCGALVAPGDRSGLGVAIGELLRDDVRRRALSAAGVCRARTEFSVDRMLTRTVDVYRSVGATPD